MKTKLLSILCAIAILTAGVFVFSGCGKKEDENTGKSGETAVQTSGTAAAEPAPADAGASASVGQLRFSYADGTALTDTTNGKMLTFENYKIIVSFQTEKTAAELAESRGMTGAGETPYNGETWQVYEYADAQVESVIHMLERDGGTYVVTVSKDAGSGTELRSEIADFMSGVAFAAE